MRAVIIGLGLIGGSVAINLRKSGRADEIIGIDSDPLNANKALEIGLIDSIGDLDESIHEADLVILAIPVDAAKALLPNILADIKESTVVIDMGSTKQGICDRVRVNRRRGRYVASHPIAGTENTGPEAAFENLFKGKVGIICEKERSDDDALQLAEELYGILEMNLVFMDAKDHDLDQGREHHLMVSKNLFHPRP